ncbi:MAG TPA: sigma-54 dependent transcriptional regulator [Terriglobales bacterium]|nr:sigma-54 dependent transcriptional regulator [Terriglobales bacterium]
MSTAIARTVFAPTVLVTNENIDPLNLLIIDDDYAVRKAAREAASTLGHRAQSCESIDEATRILESRDLDVVLLDLKPRGLETLRQIKHSHPDITVIVISGHGTIESAVKAMQAGAYDYMTKPFSLEELKLMLQRAAAHLKVKTENRALHEKMKSTHGFGSIIGRAPEMEKLYRMIAKAAHSTHPVLILGESGTGKEMVARAIHYSGPYRDKAFIPVDCGSLVPSLIESELFGHAKGAFTGALQSKAGLLSIAEGGTVFLDEIGELPVDLQSTLLRALQEKEIRPVGSTKTIPINIRILAATNRDLESAVVKGSFRRDLFFRLNVLTLRIPPLRERRDDIPVLTGHILERLARTSGQTHELSQDAVRALLAYDWPGNVRELENCLERCCAITTGCAIHFVDLPSSITGAPLASSAGASEKGIIPLVTLEKQAILCAIAQLNGDKLSAAKMLGIGKTTMYRKLKEYGAHL